MPSPFETIAGAAQGGEQATPVHHEEIQGPLEAQIGEHDEALKGYMGRLSAGQTLHPDEYHDYENRMKEKSHDSGLLNKLNKQHGMLKRRGNEDMRKHREQGTRTEAGELLHEYGGGSQ